MAHSRRHSTFSLLLAPGLLVFAVTAHADLGTDIRSQCSVQGLRLESAAAKIASGRLVEARQLKEYFTGQTTHRSEVAADAESLNHYRMQVQVENVKYQQSRCILGLIEKRVGANAKISKLKDSAEGRKLLAEYEAFVKSEHAKLNEIRQALAACEKLKDVAAARECKLKSYAEEVGHFEPTALFEEIQKAGRVGFIDGRQDVLATYTQNRLNGIRDFIKELNDTLGSSGDRFGTAPDQTPGRD